jgi:hypothetical protein
MLVLEFESMLRLFVDRHDVGRLRSAASSSTPPAIRWKMAFIYDRSVERALVYDATLPIAVGALGTWALQRNPPNDGPRAVPSIDERGRAMQKWAAHLGGWHWQC